MQSNSALRFAAKDSRVGSAGDARDHSPLQRAIDVHRSAGDDFGARSDAADDRDVAFEMMDRLSGAQIAVDEERRFGGRRRCAGRGRVGRGLLVLREFLRANDASSGDRGGRCGPTTSGSDSRPP